MINIRNAKQYIENFLYIRTKEARLQRLHLNSAQARLYRVIQEQAEKGRPIRIIILKARQMGFSTLVEALIFWKTATKRHVDSLIVAHTEEATGNLFRMSKRYYENLPREIRPQMRASNAQELLFDRSAKSPAGTMGLGSRIRCATAGGQGVGRSYTLQAVHMSEYAFWPGDKNDTYTGIMQAVPDIPGTMVIIESTANGYDEFKDLWDAAVEAQRRGDEDGFIPVFFPWHEMAEYRRTPPPDFTRTEEEEKLAAAYHLEDSQLYWRRWCIRNNCAGDTDKFRQEYPASPDEAFLATGSCVFDKEQLVLRRKEAELLPYTAGQFTYDFDDRQPGGQKLRNIRFQADPKGCIRIFHKPESGVPYVLGGDTAGTGSDKFTGQVLDNRTGAQAAVLQHQFDETMYTRQMYCLGMYYNEALLGVETNYSTYPEKELERLGYRHLYVRERVDTFTGALTKSYGFETTTRTRPLIIDGLKDVVRNEIQLIGDYETLGEMLTFVYDEKWKGQAEVGKHDDLVMALAIAHFIRPQQRYTAEREENGRTKWTASMWEDFENATSEGRAYLLEKWGRPEQ